MRAAIPSVEEVKVKISPRSTVRQLRRMVCRKIGIEPDLTILLLDGRPISESLMVKELDLGSRKIVVDYLWARHLILWGTKGQARLRNSSVLIAGAGAIGNEIAKSLAMLGVRNLIIVDNDIVELSNVSRMIFFEKEDVGRSKAEVLSERLRARYSYTKTSGHDSAIEKVPLTLLLRSNVIVSGLDNIVSRIYLSSISRKYQIPMVDAGIIGYEARVQTYIPPESPCPICPMPAGRYPELVGLRNPCDAPVDEGKTPSLSTSISLVSSIQAGEVLKILLGYSEYVKTNHWPREFGIPMKGTLIIDLRYNRYSIMELNRNPYCIVCGKEGIAKEVAARMELPISTSTHPRELKKYLRSKLGRRSGDFKLFRMTSKGLRKVLPNINLRSQGVRQGHFLHVIFKRQAEHYEEAVAKVA